MLPMSEFIECTQASHFSPTSSFVACLLTAAPLLLYAAFQLWRHIVYTRRATVAAHLHLEAGDMKRGLTVVRGRIDAALQEAPVSVVTVAEADPKGGPGEGPTWRTVSEEAHARPFELLSDSGGRLLVEPGDHPRLVDEPEVLESSSNRRTLAVRLVPGERLFAVGALGTYEPGGNRVSRSAKARPVLRAPASGPMILSSLALDKPFRDKARLSLALLKAALVIFAVAQLCFLGYYVRAAAGTAVDATYFATVRKLRWDYEHEREFAVVDRVDGRGQVEEAASEACLSRFEKGTRVRAVVVEGAHVFDQFGSRPTVSIGYVLFAWLAQAIGGVVIAVLRWYLRPSYREFEF